MLYKKKNRLPVPKLIKKNFVAPNLTKLLIKKPVVFKWKLTRFYWILWIQKTIFSGWKLKSMPIFILSNLIPFTLHNIFLISFCWKTRFIFSKAAAVERMWMYKFFGKKFFPWITSKRLYRKLFRFRHQKFIWNKLWKINNYLALKLIWRKWELVIRRNWYYLARSTQFSNLCLYHQDPYFFFQKVLKKTAKFNIVFALTRVLTKRMRFQKSKNIFTRISFFLAWSLRKLFSNVLLARKIEKYKKKFYATQIKITSFYKIFRDEFFIPFKFFLTSKTFFRLNNVFSFLLPTRKSVIKNYAPILALFSARFNISATNVKNIWRVWFQYHYWNKIGYFFFNILWLEKIIKPIVLFFQQFEWHFDIFYTWSFFDTFFLKKNLIPWMPRKWVKWFMGQSLDNHGLAAVSEATKNQKLMTLLFYHFMDEIHQIFFSFSPLWITLLSSKNWKFFFKKQMKKFIFPSWNWELLTAYQKRYTSLKAEYYTKLDVFLRNWFSFKWQFFDFFFFFKPWAMNQYFQKIWTKLLDKGPNYNLYGFIAWNYLPIFFLWPKITWRFFYMKGLLKKRWFSKWFALGKLKTNYDTFMLLQNKFWSKFYSKKSVFEKFSVYGFTYWNGLLDINLDWNFTVGYQGRLGFKLWKKTSLKISKKKLMSESLMSGFFAIKRATPIFYLLFTFLSRIHLLQYLVQFGHTKANYNTSFRDYIVLVYNEWFILNILAIQLSLKRNFKIMFKMFFLGGFVCLVGTFNILLEGLVNIYGAFSEQPYTRYIWVNGLFSNFDKIFTTMQTKFSNLYSARVYFTKRNLRELMHLWFSAKGLLQNLSIDINFFPSLYRSSWVFLEACARFYPTITTSNTECFLPTVYLEYTVVSNDYSLLSLSLYVNILLVIYKRSRLTRQAEFSTYPQKLLSLTLSQKIIPYTYNLKYYSFFKKIRLVTAMVRECWFGFFDLSKDQMSFIFKYFFLYRSYNLSLHRKQKFWKFFHYTPRKTLSQFFFHSVAQR